MPNIKESLIIKAIVNSLLDGKDKNMKEMSERLSSELKTRVTRERISRINRGQVHRQEELTYPINTKYTRGAAIPIDAKCPVCNDPAVVRYNEVPYCKRHYLQMARHGKTFKTIYDPNDYIEYDDYIEIILRDVKGNERGRTKIDLEDKDAVLKFKWYLSSQGKDYCQGTLSNGIKVRLHHFVLGVSNLLDNNLIVDHINGDSLDNRKENLRITTPKENARNIIKQDSQVGVKPYQLKDGTIRYTARITANYQSISLGTFDTIEEAIEARKKGEEKYWSKK